jgi:hypothetical protein
LTALGVARIGNLSGLGIDRRSGQKMKRYLKVALGAALSALVLAASAFAAAPANTAPPTVTGTPEVGSTLTTSNGTWSNSPTSYSYRWQRCTGTTCTNITGATTHSYVVQEADAGHTLRSVVTATNADGSSSANSAPTATATAGTGPKNTLHPVVLGDAYVGELLAAGNGKWTPEPDSYTYHWFQCNSAGGSCTPIAGATASRYRVRLADLYQTIRVAVTAHSSSGSTTATSPSTDQVQLVQPVVVAGNATPRLKFSSLRRLGNRVYARFSVCDDSGRISVLERDSKTATLGYVRKFAVTTTSCVTATRSWTPAARFRVKGGTLHVSLQAVDKSGKRSAILSRSLRWR